MTSPNQKINRPPVVAVVGHIDHGKSTLLDYIRKTNVVDNEAGGITQHISAYEVKHQDRLITFLDTPGHEAFSAMRNRGAKISDIAILVVSAEEGVKTQTIEALNSIKESNIPFVIAINKIDRPNANPELVKKELAEKEIYVESYGGKIPSVNVSAKTGQGIDELLDMLILLGDLEELTGELNKEGEGYILETNRDPKTGITVTAIIKDGTFNQGDFVCADKVNTKIKKLENFKGETIKTATFSSPVLIYGFNDIPKVGSLIKVFKNKKEAEKYASENSQTDSLNVNNQNEIKSLVEIPILIKADMIGTLEAVEQAISNIKDDRVNLKIINKGVGLINDSDIKLAAASDQSIIIGFNVKADKTAIDLATRTGISIETFNIIYKLTEWLEEKILTFRPKIMTEKSLGKLRVLKFFSQTKDKQVIGGETIEGIIYKGKEVKITRRETEIGKGKITELQVNKIKADKVEAKDQCGLMIESKITVAPGDILEAFDQVYE